jgi:membrane-associated phospholipid phosphatase
MALADSADGTSAVATGESRSDPEASSWSDGLLLVIALGYAAFVALLMIVRGVAPSPDVAIVALGFAVVLTLRSRLTLLREWTPFLLLFLAYELMRGLADDAGLPVHVADVVSAERALFLGHLPTAVLQGWLHPASGVDVLAVIGTIVYMLHFPLPVVTGLVLWRWRPTLFHPYLVALILLSFAGFVTFLLVPVAPPWLVAQMGQLNAPPGEHPIAYLKPDAFSAIAGFFGLPGPSLYDVTFLSINANPVAAFPSLHAAYPFLTFLVLRQAFGWVGWVALAYAALVSVTIVYAADHWVIDVIAGIVYAIGAYALMWWMVRRRERSRQAVRAGEA